MRQQRARGRWGQRLLACALVGGLLSVALAACAPTPPPPAPYFRAIDLSMDSPTDGWAIGWWITPASTPGHEPESTPAMAHYQHGQWRLAPQSVTGTLDYTQSLDLIRMLSPSDGWAVTVKGIEHYDGVRWRIVDPSSPGPNANDMAFLSPTEGWMVGIYSVMQFTHGVWRDVTASLPPRPADWPAAWDYPGLHSVAVVSATQAWATGDGGMIWRYDGQQWRIVTSPYFPNNLVPTGVAPTAPHNPDLLAHATLLTHRFGALFATQMLSDAEGWSVGGPNAGILRGDLFWGPAVVEHYQAGAWRIAHIVPGVISMAPGAPTLTCLAMLSSQEGWMGGAWVQVTSRWSGGDEPPTSGPNLYAPLLLHYHAGQWSFVATPAVGAIHRLVMLSPDDGWAAADGGLLHYADGQWRLAPVLPAN